MPILLKIKMLYSTPSVFAPVINLNLAYFT
jgi:hypothetical protein